jgi:hypothetical protein
VFSDPSAFENVGGRFAAGDGDGRGVLVEAAEVGMAGVRL